MEINTEFKFIEGKKDEFEYRRNMGNILSNMEIAYQLKRIADKLESSSNN